MLPPVGRFDEQGLADVGVLRGFNAECARVLPGSVGRAAGLGGCQLDALALVFDGGWVKVAWQQVVLGHEQVLRQQHRVEFGLDQVDSAVDGGIALVLNGVVLTVGHLVVGPHPW